eukprot:Platyproteum_vivax@DN7033_c0_g1_i2.p1
MEIVNEFLPCYTPNPFAIPFYERFNTVVLFWRENIKRSKPILVGSITAKEKNDEESLGRDPPEAPKATWAEKIKGGRSWYRSNLSVSFQKAYVMHVPVLLPWMDPLQDLPTTPLNMPNYHFIVRTTLYEATVDYPPTAIEKWPYAADMAALHGLLNFYTKESVNLIDRVVEREAWAVVGKYKTCVMLIVPDEEGILIYMRFSIKPELLQEVLKSEMRRTTSKTKKWFVWGLNNQDGPYSCLDSESRFHSVHDVGAFFQKIAAKIKREQKGMLLLPAKAVSEVLKSIHSKTVFKDGGPYKVPIKPVPLTENDEEACYFLPDRYRSGMPPPDTMFPLFKHSLKVEAKLKSIQKLQTKGNLVTKETEEGDAVLKKHAPSTGGSSKLASKTSISESKNALEQDNQYQTSIATAPAKAKPSCATLYSSSKLLLIILYGL